MDSGGQQAKVFLQPCAGMHAHRAQDSTVTIRTGRVLSIDPWLQSAHFHLLSLRTPNSREQETHEPIHCTAKMPRPKKHFKWGPHKELLTSMFLEQKKPLSEIQEYMRVHYNFAPRCVTLISLTIRISRSRVRAPVDHNDTCPLFTYTPHTSSSTTHPRLTTVQSPRIPTSIQKLGLSRPLEIPLEG